MATARKSAAAKAAKPAPAPEPVVEPAPEAAVVNPAPEPVADAVEAVLERGSVEEETVVLYSAERSEPLAEIQVGPADEGDSPAEPAPAPASAPIDAPAAPESVSEAKPGGLNVPGPIDGAEGQVATQMVVNGNAGPSQEYINGITGEPVDPDDMFDLEFAHGSTYKTKIRLIERLHYPGQYDSNSRIVFGIGARYNAADVARLTAHIKAVQAKQAAESEQAVEIGDEQH